MNEIVIIFKGGTKATYTTNVLELAKTDKDVKCIYDAETGEIIFEN